MKIIDEYSNKKIYHHLMECRPKDKVVFIFFDMNTMEMFNAVIKDKLLSVYSHINILSLIKYFDSNINVDNGILSGNMNRSYYKECGYSIIFNIPICYDISTFNSSIIGIPNLSVIGSKYAYHDIFTQYKLDNFVVIHVDSESDVYDVGIEIEKQYICDKKVVLVGDRLVCSRIVHEVSTRDLVVLYNPFYIDAVKKKAKKILSF